MSAGESQMTYNRQLPMGTLLCGSFVRLHRGSLTSGHLRKIGCLECRLRCPQLGIVKRFRVGRIGYALSALVKPYLFPERSSRRESGSQATALQGPPTRHSADPTWWGRACVVAWFRPPARKGHPFRRIRAFELDLGFGPQFKFSGRLGTRMGGPFRIR